MQSVDFPQSICQFGIARRDITPPVGIYHRMWGAAEHDRSEGVHRPLFATAMVFQASTPAQDARGESSSQQVVIALDHCLLLAPEMNELLEKVGEACEIAPSELLVVFSHTHGAGLMDRRRESLPGGEMITPYFEKMTQRIIEAVQEAVASIQPAVITYACGKCSLAAHRDYWDEKNAMFVCGFNPQEDADDTLLTARVTDENDQLLATVVNYACHPTTLAWENRLISPDFPGAMRELIEQATDAPCVFLQGASGELGPRDGFVGDTATADRNGRQLGYAAMASLEGMPPPTRGLPSRLAYEGPVVSGATIGVWSYQTLDQKESEYKSIWRKIFQEVKLPYRRGLPTEEKLRKELFRWEQAEAAARKLGDLQTAADARAMAERKNRWLGRVAGLPPGDSFPFPVRVWRMGDAVWIAVEGEPYNLLQRRLRERFPNSPLMVMALANGSRPCYLPPAEIYGKGIYQESLAILKKGSLETLIDAATKMIDELL